MNDSIVVGGGEDEEGFRGDCTKLFTALKNMENAPLWDPQLEQDMLKLLERIGLVISYRHGPKLLAMTADAIKHICRHPVLPIVFVEIMNLSENNEIYSQAADILYKLIIKSNAVTEMDRKTIRKIFSDPLNFKGLIDGFERIQSTFSLERTISVFDMQLKVLKIIHCIYVKKGSQIQTSLVSISNINYIKSTLGIYKTNAEISYYLLELIKILCRNKHNCFAFCCDTFINSFVMAVQVTNKFAMGVTILKFLSKSSDAAQVMNKSELLLSFMLKNLLPEKSINKKHFVTTLYRITYVPDLISKYTLWTHTLDFFIKYDQLEDQRSHLIATKLYTILNRGLVRKCLSINPYELDVNLPENCKEMMCRTTSGNDESDDESADEEDENNNDKKTTEDFHKEDLSDDDDVSDDDDDSEMDKCDYEELALKSKPAVISFGDNELKTHMKALFKELDSSVTKHSKTNLKIYTGLTDMADSESRNRIISQRTRMNSGINNRAFPDLVEEKESKDQSVVSPQINCFSVEKLVHKLRVSKRLDSSNYHEKIIYDRDSILEDEIVTQPDIPSPQYLNIDLQRRIDNARNCKRNSRKMSKIDANVSLQFESRFESGNLRKAIQIGEFEYNLLLSPDVNMSVGLQWFYFQLTNMKSGTPYIFNIINFVKVNSQFNYGLQPVLFSVIDYVANGIGWRKAGEKIIYYGNEFQDQNTGKQLRTLSFSITFPHNQDYCYLAYHYPYTYTKLLTKIAPYLTTDPAIIYSRIDRLCATVNGANEVPLLTVTSSRSRDHLARVSFNKRPFVFLTARVHPCESNASWIMDGVLQFLLDVTDDRALEARDRFIFKITPMLNPEGVIHGNSRCGLTGNDLNRCWKRPDRQLHPEIFYTKELIRYATHVLNHPIVTFVDIHGHSRKKFFFLYGCNPKLSWNETDKRCADARSTEYNSLPVALSTNDSMKLHFCRFSIEKKKESTCRIVMWREFGIKRSYTLECSYCSGVNKRKMTTAMLREIGTSVVTALQNLQDTTA